MIQVRHAKQYEEGSPEEHKSTKILQSQRNERSYWGYQKGGIGYMELVRILLLWELWEKNLILRLFTQSYQEQEGKLPLTH